MSNLPLDFPDKVNSPELEAFFEQFGLSRYISAPEFNKVRDAINELFLYSDVGSDVENKLLTISKIEIIDNVLYVRNYSSPIIMRLSRWIIGNELYADGIERSFPIPPSTAGHFRCDLLVVTNNPEAPFKYILGDEDPDNFIEPSFDLFSEIKVIPVYVTGSVIEIDDPVIGSDYVTKAGFTNFTFTGSEFSQTFTGITQGTRNKYINPASPGIGSFSGYVVQEGSGVYDGMMCKVENRRSTNVRMRNKSTSTPPPGSQYTYTKFDFRNDALEFYLLRPGEVLTFVIIGGFAVLVSSNMIIDSGTSQNLQQVLELGSEAVLDYGETVSIKIDRNLEDSSETEFLQQNDKIAIVKKSGDNFAEAYADGDSDTQKAGLRVGTEGDPSYYNAIELENGSMTVIDRKEGIGLVYEGEYESNFIDKSLVSKKFVVSKIAEAIGDISTVSFLAVEVLPETGQANIIYLVPNGEAAPNVKDEFIWLSGAWELIGSTELDLSNYVLKQAVIGNPGELPFTNPAGDGTDLRKITRADILSFTSGLVGLSAGNWYNYQVATSASASSVPFRTTTPSPGRLKASNAIDNEDLVPLGQLNTILEDYAQLSNLDSFTAHYAFDMAELKNIHESSGFQLSLLDIFAKAGLTYEGQAVAFLDSFARVRNVGSNAFAFDVSRLDSLGNVKGHVFNGVDYDHFPTNPTSYDIVLEKKWDKENGYESSLSGLFLDVLENPVGDSTNRIDVWFKFKILKFD